VAWSPTNRPGANGLSRSRFPLPGKPPPSASFQPLGRRPKSSWIKSHEITRERPPRPLGSEIDPSSPPTSEPSLRGGRGFGG